MQDSKAQSYDWSKRKKDRLKPGWVGGFGPSPQGLNLVICPPRQNTAALKQVGSKMKELTWYVRQHGRIRASRTGLRQPCHLR